MIIRWVEKERKDREIVVHFFSLLSEWVRVKGRKKKRGCRIGAKPCPSGMEIKNRKNKIE